MLLTCVSKVDNKFLPVFKIIYFSFTYLVFYKYLCYIYMCIYICKQRMLALKYLCVSCEIPKPWHFLLTNQFGVEKFNARISRRVFAAEQQIQSHLQWKTCLLHLCRYESRREAYKCCILMYASSNLNAFVCIISCRSISQRLKSVKKEGSSSTYLCMLQDTFLYYL